jgi:hypothetical protein
MAEEPVMIVAKTMDLYPGIKWQAISIFDNGGIQQ